MVPTETSKLRASMRRSTRAWRPRLLSLTRSPTLMPRGRCGWAAGSFLSARVVWATTVDLNWSVNSRRLRAMRRAASFWIFWARLLSVDGLDDLAELVLEVVDERGELELQLAGAGFLLGAAFEIEAGAFAGELLLPMAEGEALGLGGGELLVELVEEGADVGGLGGHVGAGGSDDVRCEAKALRDVEACGSAGDAEAQLVGGGERGLVEADGGIQDTWTAGGVDLERGEVRRDAGPGALGKEMRLRRLRPAQRLLQGRWRSRGSSSRTRESWSALREMRSTLTTWAEKLERFCSMDWASPMSA